MIMRIHLTGIVTEAVIPVLLPALLLLATASLAGHFFCRYAVSHWHAPPQRTTLYFLGSTIIIALLNGIRYTDSVTAMKGLIFGLILTFAAYSDICRREVDDGLSVMLLICACIGKTVTDLPSMLVAAFLSVLPMFLTALRMKRGAIGGADLKITAAAACILGWERTFPAVIGGLLIAILVNHIRHKRAGVPDSGFPLVPYLAVGFMTAYLI